VKALHDLSNLDVSFVSLVNRPAVRDPSNPNEPHRLLLTKSETPVVDMTVGGATQTEGGQMPDTEAELRAALEKAEQENEQLRKAEEDRKVRKAAKKARKPKPTAANPDPDHDGDNDLTAAGDTDHDYHPSKGAKMSKSEKEELRKAEDRIKKAEDRAQAAEKIAKEERDLRVKSEFVDLAKSDLPHLGGSDEVGAELHRLSEVLSKDEFDAHLTRQRAINEQIATSDLYKQFGVDGSPDPSSQSAVEKVAKEAAELRKADPNLDSYEAMRAAVRSQPDLILNNR